MDLDKFDFETVNTSHKCVSKEKLNALLNEYQNQYNAKFPKKNKTQDIIILEPKFKKRRRNNFKVAMKCLVHGLYYCNILNLLPCDSGVCMNIPPWKYEYPKQKLNIEEFLIEPDWNSI